MIEQLKKIFPSIIITTNIEQNLDMQYEWYLSKTKELIGIHKSELTNKEKKLLATFLHPYSITFPLPTEKEKIWEDRIHQKNHSKLEENIRYRFVYFSIANNQIDPKSFKEAINELFHAQVSVIWDNQREGIIIEETTSDRDEEISYEEIIDILMSDLYVKINVLVGPFQEDLYHINDHYHNILKSARVSFTYTDRNVISYVEAIPHILINQVDVAFKREISATVLKEFATDQDIIQTIEVFLESNLNISVAAKKLYMHRNSLQYRLDKFYESTGIDVRDFHQALPVYLALLANQ
ncbi:PucR family transcriptional regulator [Ornithinibacillus salinisoli]|uniref:PucR family transcriptional regulator n=1 Tax=Ornithinibacillus salinisoli TaxID=1848459 RepID=A0ABW4VSY5_9BACI